MKIPREKPMLATIAFGAYLNSLLDMLPFVPVNEAFFYFDKCNAKAASGGS